MSDGDEAAVLFLVLAGRTSDWQTGRFYRLDGTPIIGWMDAFCRLVGRHAESGVRIFIGTAAARLFPARSAPPQIREPDSGFCQWIRERASGFVGERAGAVGIEHTLEEDRALDVVVAGDAVGHTMGLPQLPAHIEARRAVQEASRSRFRIGAQAGLQGDGQLRLLRRDGSAEQRGESSIGFAPRIASSTAAGYGLWDRVTPVVTVSGTDSRTSALDAAISMV